MAEQYYSRGKIPIAALNAKVADLNQRRLDALGAEVPRVDEYARLTRYVDALRKANPEHFRRVERLARFAEDSGEALPPALMETLESTFRKRAQSRGLKPDLFNNEGAPEYYMVHEGLGAEPAAIRARAHQATLRGEELDAPTRQTNELLQYARMQGLSPNVVYQVSKTVAGEAESFFRPRQEPDGQVPPEILKQRAEYATDLVRQGVAALGPAVVQLPAMFRLVRMSLSSPAARTSPEDVAGRAFQIITAVGAHAKQDAGFLPYVQEILEDPKLLPAVEAQLRENSTSALAKLAELRVREVKASAVLGLGLDGGTLPADFAQGFKKEQRLVAFGQAGGFEGAATRVAQRQVVVQALDQLRGATTLPGKTEAALQYAGALARLPGQTAMPLAERARDVLLRLGIFEEKMLPSAETLEAVTARMQAEGELAAPENLKLLGFTNLAQSKRAPEDLIAADGEATAQVAAELEKPAPGIDVALRARHFREFQAAVKEQRTRKLEHPDAAQYHVTKRAFVRRQTFDVAEKVASKLQEYTNQAAREQLAEEAPLGGALSDVGLAAGGGEALLMTPASMAGFLKEDAGWKNLTVEVAGLQVPLRHLVPAAALDQIAQVSWKDRMASSQLFPVGGTAVAALARVGRNVMAGDQHIGRGVFSEFRPGSGPIASRLQFALHGGIREFLQKAAVVPMGAGEAKAQIDLTRLTPGAEKTIAVQGTNDVLRLNEIGQWTEQEHALAMAYFHDTKASELATLSRLNKALTPESAAAKLRLQIAAERQARAAGDMPQPVVVPTRHR